MTGRHVESRAADRRRDGLEALEELSRAADAGEPYPLLVTDVSMPGLDGFSLAERVRGDSRLAGTTIVVLTSAGQRGDARQCRELGLSCYLTKPVGHGELLEALLRVAVPQRRPPAPNLVTRHSLREGGASLRVLLAEDNAVNQRLASRLLEKHGHRVVVASNGREALACHEREVFDLILMDIQMPEIDGFEAVAAIRGREAATGDHIPILAMTAHAMQGDRDRCLAAGMDGYLSKPIDAKEFLEAVQAVMLG